MAEEKMRYAVVTGGNRGIGFEICRQLAEKGIKVVLTARDEKRGLSAVENLKSSGLSDSVVFHQLDVADPASVTALADFVKAQFGKLDILVNNAGISGVIWNTNMLTEVGNEIWKATTSTYELGEECLQINYYGAKRTTETFLPLLQLSDAPRIVNVSSQAAQLQYQQHEWAKGVLSDAENLSEDKVNMVLSEFMKDFKEGSIDTKGWPAIFSAYTLSKAAMNAYTRILAKKYPSLVINCVCPGYVKTDINCNTGHLTVEEGAESPVKLALLPNGGPSGLFFVRREVSPF